MPTLFESHKQIDTEIDPDGNGTFPRLYILDESWFVSQQNEVDIEIYSRIGTGVPTHSALTLSTIKSINLTLKEKILGLGVERNNLFKIRFTSDAKLANIQFKSNVYEALQSLMMSFDLTPGEIFIVNIGTTTDGKRNPIVKDPLCRNLLLKIIEDFGVIVLIASGNTFEVLGISENVIGSVIVVGSFIEIDGNFTTESRFGQGVTCYAEGDEQINGFGQSSFATAQMAGVVMEMQKYVRIKNPNNDLLTPAEVKNILKNKGKKITIAGVQNCNIPVWPDIQAAIDEIR